MAQSNASRRPQPTTEIGGRQYEPAKNETEMRRITIENMKADLKVSKADAPIALPQGQIPLAITANTSVLEVNFIPIEKSYEETVTKENVDSKLSHTSDKNIPSQAQGGFGEHMARCIAVDQLGITLVDFDVCAHGIDIIGIDKDGHYCLIEAKCTNSKDGKKDLEIYDLQYKNGLPVKDIDGKKDRKMEQAGLDWTTDRLNRMQIPGDELYSEKNAALASKIQKEFDRQDGSVKRYLVHTNVNTLNVIVNQDHGDGDWQFESAFRCTDQ